MTGEQTPSLRVARSCVFSPVNPPFRRRVRGSQGVFSRRMSGKRRISYLDEETTSSRRIRLLECFLLVLLFRFQGTFPLRGNDYISFFWLCPKKLPPYSFRKSLARAKKKRVIAYKEFSSIRNSRGWGTVDCPECVETT